jgi:hypothetical protein
MKRALALAALLTLSQLGYAQEPAPAAPADVKPLDQIDRFSLTVYSTADPATFDPKGNPNQPNYYTQGGQQVLPGYGVVRERRPIELREGVSTIRFTDVAAGIDPTTVAFESLTDPAGTTVLEQNYEYDLVNSLKLLEKYVDQEVIVERSLGDGKTETLRGTLLSATNHLVLKLNDGDVRIINGYNGVQLTSAKGLITKPTLVWQLTTKQPGKHDAMVTYQTDGITWRADYNLVLNEKDTAADVGAWVTVVNRSGAGYPEARLKLVAGDVQRIQPRQQVYAEMAAPRAMSGLSDKQQGFAEKSFFEYHLYTLGRTTSLPNNSVKQIELFEAKKDVPAEKIFVYYGTPEQFRFYIASEPMIDRNLGTETNKKVDTYLQIQNTEKNGLGIPMPAGRVRVYKRDDADKTNEFVGEDVIQHTAKDEKILIKLGSAFDIVGERKQTNFTINANGHVITESFEIKLRNHKKEPATILVKENLFRWTNWEITNESDKHEKQDYRTIHFPVTVPPDGEKTVTYTVKYTW